jgi:hypothetical protein
MARRFDPNLASMPAGSSAPPARMKAPNGAVVYREAPEAVDLASGSG